jgi:hypothetical protein
MRPSFAERDSFRAALSQAYADGRIDDDEFERRSTLVETGVHAADLREALADLPQPEVEFPTTLTRAEALDRRRRLQATGAPKYGRRALLAGGAAVLGFVVAGGLGRVFGDSGGSDADDDAAAGAAEPAGDFVHDSTALNAFIEKVKGKGYTHFMTIDIYPHNVQATARSLKSMSGIDVLSDYGDGKVEADPAGHLPNDVELFALDDFAVDLIPAMAREAQKKLGGQNGVHVMLNMGPGHIDDHMEPMITVYIEGGDYGEGAGQVVWTGDGKQLDSIRREDEG